MRTSGLITEMQRVVAELIQDEEEARRIVYALLKEFGGERYYIPKHDYQTRNREILELHTLGLTVEQLAKRYQLSEKTICRVVNQF